MGLYKYLSFYDLKKSWAAQFQKAAMAMGQICHINTHIYIAATVRILNFLGTGCCRFLGLWRCVFVHFKGCDVANFWDYDIAF